ncbi:MAG: hypothetical protein M1817_004719 [Caeruleum heppii]|nr:MAG: hypothetical protein M1817_004719 [Caeruleum heppii]
MTFEDLAIELLLEIMSSCCSVADVVHLASSCRRFHKAFVGSRKLSILERATENQYGPLSDAVQLLTQNDSQPAHTHRSVPFSLALLKQIMEVGRVARQWENIYPFKKWKYNFEDRRLLTDAERYRLRRAIYRLWLYHKAFHNRHHPRFSRLQRLVVLERAELLHNWRLVELAEIEDVRGVVREVLQHRICPSNGTVQRKYRKRFPDAEHQLMFNIHLNYPPPTPIVSQQFYSTPQITGADKYATKFSSSARYEPGAEGWGDEIPHYYVMEDMMKLDPGQVLWLRDNAPLKGHVEMFVRGLGDWFDNNGETFGQTLGWVMKERGESVEELKERIDSGEVGVSRDD